MNFAVNILGPAIFERNQGGFDDIAFSDQWSPGSFHLPCSGQRRTNTTADSSPGAMNSWEGLGSLTPFTAVDAAATEAFLSPTPLATDPLKLPGRGRDCRNGLRNSRAGGRIYSRSQEDSWWPVLLVFQSRSGDQFMNADLEKAVKEMGFADESEFHRLNAEARIDTPALSAAYKRWQHFDGTKKGLLALKDLCRHGNPARNCQVCEDIRTGYVNTEG